MAMVGCNGIPGMYIICCCGIDIIACRKDTQVKHSTNSPQREDRLNILVLVRLVGHSPARGTSVAGLSVVTADLQLVGKESSQPHVLLRTCVLCSVAHLSLVAVQTNGQTLDSQPEAKVKKNN